MKALLYKILEKDTLIKNMFRLVISPLSLTKDYCLKSWFKGMFFNFKKITELIVIF